MKVVMEALAPLYAFGASHGLDESMVNAVLAASVLGLLVLVAVLGLSKPKKRALDPEKYIDFKLQKKVEISHDTRLFRFALQTPDTVLGLPIGQHISLKFTDKNGKMVTRSYTPTSSDEDIGYVDFVIKVYFANVHPKFPDGGKMSQHLDSLTIGDSIAMRGPKGSLQYLGNGKFLIKKRGEVKVKNVGMIAGGTGITPMLQVMSAILKNSADKTAVKMIFANKTEEDILLYDKLEELKGRHPPNQLAIHYTLDEPPAKWAYSKGFISADMISKNLPPPSPETLILVCGPPPMIKFACEPAFKELGYTDDMWFSF